MLRFPDYYRTQVLHLGAREAGGSFVRQLSLPLPRAPFFFRLRCKRHI